MMKKIILIFIFSVCFFGSYAQDRIILKKDEKEINCRILSVNDTLITYTQQSSADSVFKIRRYDVLSWFISQPAPPPAKKRLISGKEKPKPESYKYLSGEEVPGYIVTSGHDTLTGYIKIKNPALNQLYVDFTGAEGHTGKFHADDAGVIAYGYEDIHYRKTDTGITDEVSNGVYSKSGKLFLQILVDGPAKLYLFTTVQFPRSVVAPGIDPPLYTGVMKQYYFMANPEGEKLLAKKKTIKGCVNRLLDDNKVLMEKIRMKGIKKHEVKKTFEDYNQWYVTNKSSLN